MYIYSSIGQPIVVGETRVPLLKSVWLNPRSHYGFTQHIAVKNPMYVKVASASINSIEINIRSDSGRLIPFVDGSKTSLTLHFKKKNG